ncbi:radical SAM family heme chaperone HemW [Rhodovibrionaceae bacterium A322]
MSGPDTVPGLPAGSSLEVTQLEATQPEVPDPGFGLYIHWPFCKAKCPYCDFNSHVREQIDQPRWRAALLKELDHFGTQTKGRRLTSVFFGGGTPSLMPPETVAALLDSLGNYWDLAEGLEVSLEANPTSAEADKFKGFALAGVNRLSIGVQALNDRDLAFLGREHSLSEALAAVKLAERSVPRFSFDLIYARPDQRPQDWAGELIQALDLGASHLSLYQLTIEENTVFHGRRRRGELMELPEPQSAALYEATQETLIAAGLPAYEVSNHARAGQECRHNLTYWRYGDYVGIGPGAHGRLAQAGNNKGPGGKVATRQHRAPEIWLQTVEQAGHATRSRESLDQQDRFEEQVIMGLRLQEGLFRANVLQETGESLDRQIEPHALNNLLAAGYLEDHGDRLVATLDGRTRLNAVIAHLLGA